MRGDDGDEVKRGAALTRRTPLAAASAPMRRTEFRAKPREATKSHAKSREATRSRASSPAVQITPAVRAGVYERDGYRCQACGAPYPLTIQHRAARGMGGTRDPESIAASNLVTMCGSGTTGCHGLAEANPTTAEAEGWRLSPGIPAAEQPILRFDGAWVLLADDFTIKIQDAA